MELTKSVVHKREIIKKRDTSIRSLESELTLAHDAI